MVEKVLRYQRCGSLRNAHISLVHLFFSNAYPFKYYTIFTAEFYSCCHIMIVILPNVGTAATLLYVNRELTYTTRLADSAARILRAGGGTRNVLYSGDFGQRLLAVLYALSRTWPSGKNASITACGSRVLISPSILRTTTPLPHRIARHCDPQRLRIFPPRRLHSLQPSKDFCSPHLMMYIS